MINPLIINEYKNNNSIFNTDDIRVKRIKDILFKHLTDNEREMFIIYLECNGRYKQFCKITQSDLASSRNYIKRVREKIRQIYNDNYTSNTDV